MQISLQMSYGIIRLSVGLKKIMVDFGLEND